MFTLICKYICRATIRQHERVTMSKKQSVNLEVDFQEILAKLAEYYSYSEIVSFSGLSSNGHVGDIISGRNTGFGKQGNIAARLLTEHKRLVDAERNKKGVKK